MLSTPECLAIAVIGGAPCTVMALIVARSRRVRQRSYAARTAFITGDATGSVFRNVRSDAGDFIRGDATGAVLRNVRHGPATRRQRIAGWARGKLRRA